MVAPRKESLGGHREWLADESDYDATVFPILKAEMEADRLSYRRRFKE
jgi:hypothetical protein